MKKIILLLCFMFGVTVYAQQSFFNVQILQDSICAPDSNNAIHLLKKPFKIQITFTKVEGVFLYAAFKDSIYKISSKEKIPDFENIPTMSMAEESFNINQELIISDDGWAYWFYTPEENWHRFDKDVTVSNGFITGTKSVKQFYFMANEKTLSVADITAPLYLFFFTAKQNSKGELTKELQRYKIEIIWK